MSLERLLAEVIAAVEREARLLREELLRPEGPRGRHAKAPIDTEIELRLRDTLQGLLACPFLGEETGFAPGSHERWLWLVDPHDGTKQFLEGRGGSAVSVGLLRDKVPVLGVVTSPASPDRGWDTIAWAEGCGPVNRNGQAVAADFSSRPLANRDLVWVTASGALRPETHSRAAAPARYVAIASIAYRLARIAAGDGVAAVSLHSVKEYDIAAGAALVRGSGGVLLDAEAREIVFTGEPNSRVSGCFAGAPQAARQLARFDWSALEREPRRPLRVPIGFPRLADDTRLARAQGCLLGQLIGDSLGSLVEGRDAAEIASTWPRGVRELADGGPWGTMAGQPTEAGELALELARSIVREGRFDATRALQAYRRWLASAPFCVGASVRAGLLGHSDTRVESNAALVRVSPIAVWAAGDPERAARAAREDARLTHPNPICVEACAAYAAAIATGVAGGSRDAMVAAAIATPPPEAEAVRVAIQKALASAATPFEIPQRMLRALHEAFYRLAHAPDFEEGLVAAVSAGGDSARRGAAAGALLGALHGRSGIPSRWIMPLLACRPDPHADAFRPRPMEDWPDDVLELAEALAKLAYSSSAAGS